MSERKTSEIKLRIEPSVKAEWQQLAADEQIGLSELVVKAVTEYAESDAAARTAMTLAGHPVVIKHDWSQFSNSHSSIAPKVVPTSGAEGAGTNEEEAKPYRGVATHTGGGNFVFDPPLETAKYSTDWKPWDDAA